MKRITTYDPVPPPAPLRFLGDPERPRAGHAVAARAALAVGVFVSAGFLSVMALLFYLFPGLRTYWPGFVLFAVVVGCLSAAAFGVIWVRTAVTRAWSVDDLERWRRWEIEDQERAQAQAPDAAPPTRAERIEAVVRMVLDRHYLDHQKTDRETLEAAGLVTQPEWNAANELLKAAGIKGAKGFTAADYPAAVAAWRQRVRITGGSFWLVEGDGSQKRFEI